MPLKEGRIVSNKNRKKVGVRPNSTLKNNLQGDKTTEPDKKDGKSVEPDKESSKKTAPEKKRARVKFSTALNYEALKNLENTTVGSFLELANKVILINGKSFGDATYTTAEGKEQNFKLTLGRKNDFLRLIESFAIVELIGIKCHIAKVFDKSEREELGNVLLQKRIDKMKHN